jgi:hypothetical protein
MYKESLATIQTPTFRLVWPKDAPRHTQVSFFGFRQYRQAGWADFRRIIPAPHNQADAIDQWVDSFEELSSDGGISGSRSVKKAP